ncbi:hypothetical protein E8E14_011858 [Neopestalotiopsis sp. 37M]|nr:hypothetical protein E8E14_011858 [Neopestalotiopsis sp. 37M]
MPGYEQFTGFQSDSVEKWHEVKKRKFDVKLLEDYDVDVEVECCGVCSSDIHSINGGWGNPPFPLTVGHEVVGKVVRAGPKVTLMKVGDRVGVGAQIWSCRECRQCRNDNETYCPDLIATYGNKWPQHPGVISQGGFASHVRAHQHWVFPIPPEIPSHLAAPMLCAGITSYSPLVRFGAGPGKKVGIVGVGGLGHYGILFGAALGAETWAISRTEAKKEDAIKMGAKGYLATAEKDWNMPHKGTFDLIISTANSFGDGFDLSAYLSLLDVHGKWVSVGMPEEATLTIRPQDLAGNGCFIGATHLGSRREMLDMFQLAASKNISSWVETVPINAENLSKTFKSLHENSGAVRYRYCMTDYDKEFKR